MKFKVFTVFDSKSETYLKPFLMKAKGEAVRAFTEIANDGKSEIGKYPEDFTLFEIGEFDDERGEYSMLTSKLSLGTGNEFKRQAQPSREL